MTKGKKAIIPAAVLGTRFFSAAKAMQKKCWKICLSKKSQNNLYQLEEKL